MNKTPRSSSYSLFDDIKRQSESVKNKNAVVCGKRVISYGELIESAEKYAECLNRISIKHGTRCVIIGNDTPDYLTIALGVLAAGGIFVSAGKDITKKEFESLLKRIDIEFVIVEESFCPHLDLNRMDIISSINGYSDKYKIYRRPPQGNERLMTINPAFIRFSSGTTGDSKGVVLSHDTIRDRTDAANKALRITHKDNVLWLLPMAYHFAVTIMLFLRKGCTIHIAVNESPDTILKLLSGSITFVYATPFHYWNMIKAAGKNKNAGSPAIAESVRMLISTAMPLTERLADEFVSRFGRYLNQALGIIECGLPFVNLTPDKDSVLSVGKHLPDYEVRLDTADENAEYGELVIKGPGFFDAYCSPWMERDNICSEGWFHTGDIAKFLPGEKLRIIGRKKSVINFMGLKIFPEKVEAVLNEHHSVLESRIIPREHPYYGEIPVAEIVLKSGKLKLDDIELTSFCAKSLQKFEIPQYFSVIRSIPKTRNGKIKRVFDLN